MKGGDDCLVIVESIKQLILKHLRGQLTVEEQTVLDGWLDASAANRELFLQFKDPDQVALSLEKMERMQEERVWERLRAHAAGETGAAGMEGGEIRMTEAETRMAEIGIREEDEIGAAETDVREPGEIRRAETDIGRPGHIRMAEAAETDIRESGLEQPRIGGAHRRRYGWVAAAVLIALLGTGVYWLFYHAPQKQLALTQGQRFQNDVAPGKNAALLILAGGQKIVLDSSAKGAISRQGNTTIINTNGQLVYNELLKKQGEILYNTLTTGRGNQYQLVLPDGSRVWLNAASSITYPASFTGGERKVSITGEAYFEIAKDEARPFIVQKKELSIQVLGTHFNINTYDDEDAVKTTLLEGSVKVVNGNNSSVLRPGQQAVIVKGRELVKDAGNGQEQAKGKDAGPGRTNDAISSKARGAEPIKVVDDPDIEEVMAWKNGVFRFNDATIESIMRQMARWYDVSVIYDTKITQHFIADVPRDVPVSELLKLLELTDQVHFKIEGKKITVIR